MTEGMTEGYDGVIWTSMWTRLRVYWHAAIYYKGYLEHGVLRSATRDAGPQSHHRLHH